ELRNQGDVVGPRRPGDLADLAAALDVDHRHVGRAHDEEPVRSRIERDPTGPAGALEVDRVHEMISGLSRRGTRWRRPEDDTEHDGRGETGRVPRGQARAHQSADDSRPGCSGADWARFGWPLGWRQIRSARSGGVAPSSTSTRVPRRWTAASGW